MREISSALSSFSLLSICPSEGMLHSIKRFSPIQFTRQSKAAKRFVPKRASVLRRGGIERERSEIKTRCCRMHILYFMSGNVGNSSVTHAQTHEYVMVSLLCLRVAVSPSFCGLNQCVSGRRRHFIPSNSIRSSSSARQAASDSTNTIRTHMRRIRAAFCPLALALAYV